MISARADVAQRSLQLVRRHHFHTTLATFPGRSAARSDALLTRDPVYISIMDSGSAVHRFTLHRIRGAPRQLYT
jgi:hypothetical protein